MSDAKDRTVRCMWMRGGTSKGGYFLASDLPRDDGERDALLLCVMGSPDPRQIDGMGGADPLTSKVAVVRASDRAGVDVDYLFLQVFVDQPIVTDAQNCGNILAGVGPFAIERGLVRARDGETPVTIFMENTQQIAIARINTPGRRVCYSGDARIDGVPGSAAAIPIEFRDTAGSTCGALLPSGHVVDEIDGVEVTLIDNGMPCVILRAADMGITGDETPEELEADSILRKRLETIRLKAGPMMNLGDVEKKSVPKMTMVSAPRRGGAISTRTFIPHRCHKTIGVLGAVSVATACLTKGAVGSDLAVVPEGAEKRLAIEHPTGEMTIVGHVEADGSVGRTEVLRTARKLFDGKVFARSDGVAMTPDYLPFHPNPAKPAFRVPAGAVDAHCHVFGPAAVFPFAPERKYTPCDASKEQLFALRDHLGFERNVIVQASCHGKDNRALEDALLASDGKARGVAIVGQDVSDSDLERLDRAGVRGVRFNFLKRLVDAAPQDIFRSIADRINDLGWHAVVYFEAADLADLMPFIVSLPGIVVVDHMGRPDVSDGVDGPVFKRFLEFVSDNPQIWVKVSCPERLTVAGPPYDDVIPFARTLVEHFPDRVLWGTDWPHPNMKSHMPDDGALVDVIPKIASTPALQQSLLVDNPMRLYWPGHGGAAS